MGNGGSVEKKHVTIEAPTLGFTFNGGSGILEARPLKGVADPSEVQEFVAAEEQYSDPAAMVEWRKTPILEMRAIVEEMTIAELKNDTTDGWSEKFPNPPEVIVDTSPFAPSDNAVLKALLYDPRKLIGDERRETENLPVMVYCHGGGGIFCRPSTYGSHAARYALENSMLVVNLDYRLAPDHKAPAALRDAAGMVEYLAAKGSIGGIPVDTTKIFLAGDSGGGYVAVGAGMELARRGKENLVRFCFSICGQLADTLVRLDGHRAEFGADSKNEWLWTLNQLGYSDEDVEKCDVALNYIPEEIARRLPPLVLFTSEFDICRRMNEEFAMHLKECGSDAIKEFHIHPSHSHVWNLAMNRSDDSVFWNDASKVISHYLNLEAGKV